MQHPWIGPSYGEPQNRFCGKKILVVGESHYADPAFIGTSIPGITQEVVTKYQLGEWRIPFFTRLATLITGVSAVENGIKAKALWDDLAFYNYVPVIAASSPREFNWEFWKLGVDEFNNVLKAILPDMIIVTGYRLWDMAYFRHTDESVVPGQRVKMVCNTKWGEKLIPTLIIRHPSAPGFSGLKAHSEYKLVFDSL